MESKVYALLSIIANNRVHNRVFRLWISFENDKQLKSTLQEKNEELELLINNLLPEEYVIKEIPFLIKSVKIQPEKNLIIDFSKTFYV